MIDAVLHLANYSKPQTFGQTLHPVAKYIARIYAEKMMDIQFEYMVWCHFAYSHFTYYKSKCAISPTQLKTFSK